MQVLHCAYAGNLNEHEIERISLATQAPFSGRAHDMHDPNQKKKLQNWPFFLSYRDGVCQERV